MQDIEVFKSQSGCHTVGALAAEERGRFEMLEINDAGHSMCMKRL